MFAFGIILSMIVFGGLLALLGDRVGMKVGKKRLSIFGLRPKYTSMIITVLTGFFIAGLTLIILTMMSQYARTAIFSLRAIQDRLKSTTAKVNVLTGEIQRKETEYDLLTEKFQKVQDNLVEATTERAKLEKQRDKLIAQRNQLTVQRDKLLTQRDDLVSQRNKLETQRTKLEAERAQVATQLNETRSQYQVASANLEHTTTELQFAQERLNNLTAVNDDLKNQITSLTLQETRLNQQIQNLEGWLKSLEDQNKKISDKPVVLFVGEILVSKVVEPASTADKAFADLVEPLLNAANKVALGRGARISGKNNYGIRINPRRVSEVCAQLAQLKDKAVLRAVIDKNSVVGDPAIVDLNLFPNQLLYKKGAAISAIEISRDQTESQLGDAILNLFIAAYNKTIESGIITNDANLRELISISDIVTVINLIKEKTEGKVRVAVVAVNDTYRVSALRVKFAMQEVP